MNIKLLSKPAEPLGALGTRDENRHRSINGLRHQDFCWSKARRVRASSREREQQDRWDRSKVENGR